MPGDRFTDAILHTYLGYNIGNYVLLYPLVIASTQGRGAFVQRRGDGLLRALAYAVGASAKGFASGLWNWPRVEMDLARTAYHSLIGKEVTLPNRAAWVLGLGLGSLMTVASLYSLPDSLRRAIRGRGLQRLVGLAGFGFGAYGMYKSLQQALWTHYHLGEHLRGEKR